MDTSALQMTTLLLLLLLLLFLLLSLLLFGLTTSQGVFQRKMDHTFTCKTGHWRQSAQIQWSVVPEGATFPPYSPW